MAVTLNQGFAPYLLEHIKTIVGDETPQFKLDPLGFIEMLNNQSKPKILRLNNEAGHKKSVQVNYSQPWTKAHTDTTKSCDNTNVATRKEMAVDLSSTRQFAVHIPDETIAKYEDDASRTIMQGAPATDLMNEFLQEVMGATNAILQGVEDDLLTSLVGNIGINRRTGNNAAATININRDETINPLNEGLTLLLKDYRDNRGKGTPQVVGSGLFHNFMLQQQAKSAGQSGLDTSILAQGMRFYHSLEAPSILGTNQIVVAQPNTVQWVEYLEYTGFKAGPKPGSSFFGTMGLPMQMGNDIGLVKFDFQLKYNDCAQEFTDAYYGTTLSLEKGYNLIISKQSGLFTLPTDAYRAGDALDGNRGTLRYTITNTCETCS